MMNKEKLVKPGDVKQEVSDAMFHRNIPRVYGQVSISDDARYIALECNRHGATYDISTSDLAKPRDVLDWYYHLEPKTWVSPVMLSDFMKAVDACCLIIHKDDAKSVLGLPG